MPKVILISFNHLIRNSVTWNSVLKYLNLFLRRSVCHRYKRYDFENKGSTGILLLNNLYYYETYTIFSII